MHIRTDKSPDICSHAFKKDGAAALWYQLLPTLASGYGAMTADQWGKSPKVILDEHETRLWEWVQQANPYALKGAVDTACSHSDFPQFNRDLWEPVEARKFGTSPAEDVVRFDMWLKKKEISDSLPTPTISPPQKGSNSELGPPPENAEAYKNYWKKFERKGGQSNLSVASTTPGSKSEEALGSSSTTPSRTPSDTSDPAASPDSATGITPDCKKKLDLEGWTMHVESTKFHFVTFDLYRLLPAIHHIHNHGLLMILLGISNPVPLQPGGNGGSTPRLDSQNYHSSPIESLNLKFTMVTV